VGQEEPEHTKEGVYNAKIIGTTLNGKKNRSNSKLTVSF
jgi:hypothetical protein